ncbi:hypothetical protein [Actinokineospora enzanensis]|uniref:hypothetical protein n=1 Tax=Actinokineospora enzanensis TaxID=155975 RepID=UPI0003818223|nr:hypothetical protein [Actinokineospora enzanensis]
MAYTPQQIVHLVLSGRGPGGLYSGSARCEQLSKMHKHILDDMLQLKGAMEEYWQGDASAQAYNGAGPLVEASWVSGTHLAKAKNLYSEQGRAFAALQDKITEVAPLGDKPPNDLVSNTMVSFLSGRAGEIADWNRRAQQAVDGYNAYYRESVDNSAHWEANSRYGLLGLPPGGVDIELVGPRHVSNRSITVTDSRSTSLSTHTTPDNSQQSLTFHDPDPIGDRDPGGGQVWHGDHLSHTADSPSPVNSDSSDLGAPHQPWETTTTSTYLPSASTGGVSDHGSTGYGPTGYDTTGRGSGSTGFGPGGTGFNALGVDSGAGRAGSGPRSGSFGSGTGPAALAGESALGGRGGRAGGQGGMLGAGMGGRGEGDEDTEHTTAAYLREEDPDEALVGELPNTAPPVIGL